MPRRLILLDLDDTLLYQERVNRDILFGLARDGAFPDDPRRFVETFGAVACQLWEELPTFAWTRKIGISWGEGLWGEFRGGAEPLRQLAELAANYRVVAWIETLERLGSPVSTRQAQLYAHLFAERRRATMVWVEGAVELLEWLRPRFLLGLITNGAPDLQRYKIEASGVGRWFDSVTISGDHGVGKPAVELFRIARAAFPPDLPCLMIGNSPSSDIQGATNAGLPAIWLDLKEAHLPSHLHPLAVVSGLREVPRVLVANGWVEDASPP